MASSHTTRPAAPPASALLWTPFLLLCLIGAAAALRRILALLMPSTAAGPPAMQLLDAHFAARRALTLAHLFPAITFIALVPAWFSHRIRVRVALHRRITVALFLFGALTGITALLLSGNPVGGLREQSAVLLYDTLFLVSLARAFLAHRAHQHQTRQKWMTRAIAILLGIAATRPVMAVFFATAPRTGLTPHDFFGIAFWIGFTSTFLAGELYLRSHRRLPSVQTANE